MDLHLKHQKSHAVKKKDKNINVALSIESLNTRNGNEYNSTNAYITDDHEWFIIVCVLVNNFWGGFFLLSHLL